MIGLLRGILIEKKPPQLLLLVGGVGYELDAPMSTIYRLPEIGQEVTVYTHLSVREDHHQLFAFYEQQERLLFRTLLKVNGVGPRLALTILSSLSPDTFVRCIAEQDTTSLVRIPGVGKKTAERLIIEMRDRVADWGESYTLPLQPGVAVAASKTSRGQMTQDAVSALIALGYKPQEASRAIARIDNGELSSEDMIRQALKEGIGC